MKTENEWLAEYGKSHRNALNEKIHFVCVPAINFSILAFLSALPNLPFFGDGLFGNWGILAGIGSLLFYLRIGISSFILMALTLSMMGLFIYLWSLVGGHLTSYSVGIFVIAWIGQFYGHKVEGIKPAFFQDLVFLLIGPLWVARHFTKRILNLTRSFLN